MPTNGSTAYKRDMLSAQITTSYTTPVAAKNCFFIRFRDPYSSKFMNRTFARKTGDQFLTIYYASRMFLPIFFLGIGKQPGRSKFKFNIEAH